MNTDSVQFHADCSTLIYCLQRSDFSLTVDESGAIHYSVPDLQTGTQIKGEL